MWSVQVTIQEHEVFRPSEIIADLRTAAEALYFPLRMVGFWDSHADMHLCPQEQRREVCPHRLPEDDDGYVVYDETASRDHGGDAEGGVSARQGEPVFEVGSRFGGRRRTRKLLA